MRLTREFSGLVLGLLVAVACGGQSLNHDDDSGAAGDGSSEGGTSGAGASRSGGAAGSIVTGGVSGAPFGGTSTGGSIAFGGSSAGGAAGSSGSSGAAGAAGICGLALQSGACDAYFPSFGFSQADGHCISFVYGGCGGNDNRFSTLAECEAKCGGSLSACPPERPMSAERCTLPDQVCTYDFGNCLCTPQSTDDCARVDPACDGLQYDGDVLPIIVAVYQQCTCAPGGAWECVTVLYGGR